MPNALPFKLQDSREPKINQKNQFNKNKKISINRILSNLMDQLIFKISPTFYVLVGLTPISRTHQINLI